MKKIIISLTLTLFSLITFATEIEAIVVFENLTNKEFTHGEFTIIELNQKIKVNNTESFKITLPKKGKYRFSFISNDFTAYTFYPTRINKRKKTITIRLMKKTKLNSGKIYSFPINFNTNLTDEQIEKRISEGTLNFIMHGIDRSISREYMIFKKKYGIGLIKKNCVIDPLSFKEASENNKIIFDYLNKKYGTEWLNELKEKPFGIK